MMLTHVYRDLHHHYGPQHWWPADSAFEVMVGAVLTQNTAWTNVEKALANLKTHGCLEARAIIDTPLSQLAEWLRPSGYFNIKARRLRNLCQWYLQHGGQAQLETWPTEQLRRALLAVNGVGPETADDILLYAFSRPIFVVDAYTRRLFKRLGLISGEESYETLRAMVEQGMTQDVNVFNEFHALIVNHAKQVCRKIPRCDHCALHGMCAEKSGQVQEKQYLC